MIVINFAHPLTDAQKTQIEALTQRKVERIIVVPSQFYEDRPFTDQARDVVSAIKLAEVEWQTLPLIVNLPSLSVIAALVLAEIHGRAGYFPTVLRMRASEGVVRAFEVAEILDLQRVRERARDHRT